MVCLWGAVYYPTARVWRKPLNGRSVGGDDGVVGNDDSPADEEV